MEMFLDWLHGHWIFLLVSVIVLVLACFIHYCAAECIDAEDFFIDEYGWITIVAILALALVVYGFIYWLWWAMLIIVGGLAVIAVIVFLIFYALDGGFERYDDNDYIDDDSDDDEESGKRVITRYKCPNCGAAITKYENPFGDKKKYRCDYCGTSFEKKDLKIITTCINENNEKTEIEIDDFEEEYFEACERMDFRPYNRHTYKQIDRKRDKLQDMLDNCKNIYEDVSSYDSEDILDNAYDFLTDNEGEIEEYFDKYGEATIKERYEAYRKTEGDDNDDE